MNQSLVTHDIESQETTIPETTMNSIRKLVEQENSDESLNLNTKWLISSLLILLSCPFIICDLYFAYCKTDCLTDYPKNFKVNIQEFLVVSALVSTFTIVITVVYVLFQNHEKENILFKAITYFILYIVGVFNTIWSVIGAYVYWGSFIHCEPSPISSLSNYLCVSLIIKMLSSLHYISTQKKN